jgi:ParB/RepB/Spo0J family partition protein
MRTAAVVAKRLGGGASSTTGGGKLASIAAAVQGDMGEVSRQLERPIDRNRGVFERVALENVRPDPENPRNLHLTWEELAEGIRQLAQKEEGTPRSAREKTFESIAGTATSFKNIGQLQPIILYRDDRGMLRIVDGERRYWAARVAEWKEIEAKIRPNRPKYLRLEQYAANILREDLTLSGHLNNLEMLLAEAEEQGTPVKSLNEFSTVLGKPRATVQLWWSLLRSNTDHEDVKDAIRSGSVTSLETAYAAAQEVDPGRRAALLQGHALPARNATSNVSRRTSERGRPKSAVELGRAKDLEIVRRLIEAVPVDQSFDATDWSNPKEVQRAWQAFLAAFARQVKKQAEPIQG